MQTDPKAASQKKSILLYLVLLVIFSGGIGWYLGRTSAPKMVRFAAPSEDVKVTLLPDGDKCLVVLTSGISQGVMVRTHRYDFDYELIDQNKAITKASANDKRVPPEPTDWVCLDWSSQHIYRIYPKDDIHDCFITPGWYKFRVTLLPVKKEDREKWLEKEKIWTGPKAQSNEISVQVNENSVFFSE